MSVSAVFFILLAIALVVLLLWVSRPPARKFRADQDVFELLSQPRHCSRLPQILQALRPEDTQFMRDAGRERLMHQLRKERQRIALTYLNYLQDEFETLLEISRVLAVMAPEPNTMQEMERWKLGIVFSLRCHYLGMKLRFGLHPLVAFGILSDMSSNMARQLEAITSRIAENAAQDSGLPDGKEKNG